MKCKINCKTAKLNANSRTNENENGNLLDETVGLRIEKV